VSIPVATTSPAVTERSWAGIRARIALLLVLLYAAASTARWLHRGAEWPGRPAQDEISTYERRFERLRSVLPARGVVGYLGHPDPANAARDQTNATALLHFRRYLLAQYALAPVLLIESTTPDLVVGNFDPGARPPAPAGFQVLRDFGDGLVLFRRSRP
jgi:hypothetical protein